MRRGRAVLGVVAVSLPITAAAGNAAKDQARVRRITADYGTCVVRKHHDQAKRAVLATASNREIIGPMSQIIDGDCLNGAAGYGTEMRFPNDTYQYALAEALVKADLRDKSDASFDDRLPLAQPPMPTEGERATALAAAKSDKERDAIRESINKATAFAWLARYGECVVRKDPADARYWLLTPPDTPEESSRIKAMQPAMSACMDRGTVRFNRISLRGTIAVNYYRLAMATVMPSAGSHS